MENFGGESIVAVDRGYGPFSEITGSLISALLWQELWSRSCITKGAWKELFI